MKWSRKNLINLSEDTRTNNIETDALLDELDDYLTDSSGALVRSRIITLPLIIASEYVKKWLTNNDIKDIDKMLVMRILMAAKTLDVGKKIDCGGNHWLQSSKSTLTIIQK